MLKNELDSIKEKIKTQFIADFPLDSSTAGVPFDILAKDLHVSEDEIKKACKELVVDDILKFPNEAAGDFMQPTNIFRWEIMLARNTSRILKKENVKI